MDETCPHCGTSLVAPRGRRESPILVIGEYPGDEEIEKGIPMVGAMGGVFRTEMARVGIDINRLRLTNIWLHTPNKSKECLDYGIAEAIKEAKDRKAILLLGSECVSYFCNKSVLRTCGLKVTSPYLSAPIIYSCVNPAIVFKRGGIGEVRLALKKFSKVVEGVLK